jgi:chromosome partitioning protein
MRRSVVPSSGAKSPPHVVVIGNQKGGTGKSTFAMHIIVALLKAGKRVASFDLDLNQLTLTRYLGNRHEWDRKHEQKLELPDHYPVSEEVQAAPLRRFISRVKKIGRVKSDFINSSALSHSADLSHFISQLKKIGRARKHDFIVIDTPGGVQHLSLIAHGMADTLITPINDSLVDLDVLVAMEQSDLEPQPSVYAKMVWRALEARRKVTGRTTDWIVVRNRLESVESSNQQQITQVLDVIQRTLGFRIARGLLERPVYREFFAAGLTVFDHVSDAAYAAQGSLYAKAMMKAMDGNCTNIAVLLQRYSDFCQRLSQDADPRLKEWIACIRARNQTCGGRDCQASDRSSFCLRSGEAARHATGTEAP